MLKVPGTSSLPQFEKTTKSEKKYKIIQNGKMMLKSKTPQIYLLKLIAVIYRQYGNLCTSMIGQK